MDADVCRAIQHYLDSVSRYLRSRPQARRAEILGDIESHIYEALRDRTEGREATMEDVSVVLAQMDPPESYGSPTPGSLLVHNGREVPNRVLFAVAVYALLDLGWLFWAMWVGFLIGILGGVLTAAIIYGLYVGSKAAYIATVVLTGLSIIISLGYIWVGLGSVLINCLVLVPVLQSTSYYFPGRSDRHQPLSPQG